MRDISETKYETNPREHGSAAGASEQRRSESEVLLKKSETFLPRIFSSHAAK